MDFPVQISFRGTHPSDAVEQQIRDKVEKLRQYYRDITSCRVMVEATHRNHHKGNIYHIRLEMGVPGNAVVISRTQNDNHAHEDLYVTVRDAFEAARRQLDEVSGKRQPAATRGNIDATV